MVCCFLNRRNCKDTREEMQVHEEGEESFMIIKAGYAEH